MMNYIGEALVIIISMIVGTFCVKEVVKTILVEIGIYKMKMNKPYEKAINGLFDELTVVVKLMETVLNKEMGSKEEYKVEDTLDFDDLK